MKFHRYLFIALALLIGSVAVSAQGDGDLSARGQQDDDRYARGRDSDLLRLAGQLTRQTDDLQRQMYNNYTSRTTNGRSDTQAMLAAGQLNAAATVFRTMVNDRRRRSEMRDAVDLMSDLTRSVNTDTSRYGWPNIQRTLDDLRQELSRFGGGGGNFPGGGVDHGSVSWKGTVDDEVQLKIQGRSLDTLAISGTPYNDTSYSFNGVFPNRQVNVSARKIRGRGEVRVIQQPSRQNDWTAIVQIRDRDRSSDRYEVEITW